MTQMLKQKSIVEGERTVSREPNRDKSVIMILVIHIHASYLHTIIHIAEIKLYSVVHL